MSLIEGISSLAFGNLLYTLEQGDFFTYVLPFLLIFAIVYAILEKTKILGDNKGIVSIIAIAVGLLALQFGEVTRFYEIIFPELGKWLAVMLVFVILLGLTTDLSHFGPKNMMFWIGMTIAILVLVGVFSNYNFPGSYLWQNYMNEIIWGIVIVVVVIVVANSGQKYSDKVEKHGFWDKIGGGSKP